MHFIQQGVSSLELVFAIGILVILAFGVFALSNRRKDDLLPRTRADMQAVISALESYHVDHKTFPEPVPLKDFAENEQLLENRSGGSLTAVPEFIDDLPRDPFSIGGKLPFSFARVKDGWILTSCGPDLDYDIVVPRRAYDPEQAVPSATLVQLTYDPTNGAKSDGDIWRAWQH